MKTFCISQKSIHNSALNALALKKNEKQVIKANDHFQEEGSLAEASIYVNKTKTLQVKFLHIELSQLHINYTK